MGRLALFVSALIFFGCSDAATKGGGDTGSSVEGVTDIDRTGNGGHLSFVDTPEGPEEVGVEVVEPQCTESTAADVCSDDNPCTVDDCEEGLCVNTPLDGDCDDEDACTGNDVCQAGACVGAALDESHCDDGDPCTTDTCHPSSGCKNFVLVSHDCRPNIVVDHPPRAAGLIWENLSDPSITVTGAVTSGAGPIVEFTMNGSDVPVAEDGSFSVEFTPVVGGNTLEFDARDSRNSKRRRVQSFHWSPSYLDPKEVVVDVPCDGETVEGICFKAHLDDEVQWSPAQEKCEAWGGHLASIHSQAQNAVAETQREIVCGDESAWIGMNDNLKEGDYVWVDGVKVDGSTTAQVVPATIVGLSGDPIDGKAAGAAGLDNGGAVLQDGAVGGPLGGGIYLTDATGGLPSDYLASGPPVVLDYDFGGTVPVSSLHIGLYSYEDGVGHPHSATKLSIDLGTTIGASDVAEGIIVTTDLYGPAGQLLDLGGTFNAAFARVTVTDNGFDEPSGGMDPPGGDRVAFSEAAFDEALMYTNWADGEPNDWQGDEDVIGMTSSGQWNDFNGDQGLNCYVCARPTKELAYTGHADPGMGIFLAAELIDDGDHAMPPNDLGTVLEMVFGEFDLGKMIPSPAATDLEASGAKYDLYIPGVTNDAPTVEVTLIEGGWAINAELLNVEADLHAYKTEGGWLLPGEITGTLYLETVTIKADVMMGVTPDHELDAWTENAEVSIEGSSVDIDGILGGLIEGALGDSIDTMLDDIEVTIAQELGGALAPMLIDALGSLAFGFDFELPSMSPDGEAVQIKVATDFTWVDFATDGDVLALRSVAVPTKPIVPHESKGAPGRAGCGQVEQTLEILKEAPMEIVMNDDTINMILYSAWRGAFLDFDLPQEALGDVDLEGLGVTDLVANVSGLLAPAVSDCKDGELLLHIGDIKITATMKFLENPLDMEAYVSFDAKFEILAADGKISFGVDDVSNVKLELTVLQDDQIEMEELLVLLIEESLVPALMDGLTGDSLGGLELPDIVLDAAGTPVEIGIAPLWVQRENGNSIVGAELEFLNQ